MEALCPDFCHCDNGELNGEAQVEMRRSRIDGGMSRAITRPKPVRQMAGTIDFHNHGQPLQRIVTSYTL
jgi:hypothetical protein